jgi:flagellar biogenesis protein FliO
MKATKPWIEETREFFGLLILIVALVVNMIWLGKRNRVHRIKQESLA